MKNIIFILLFMGISFGVLATPPRPAKKASKNARLSSKPIPTRPIIKNRL